MQPACRADIHAGPTTAGVRVGGVTPFSATDYPGLLSAVVFVQGCPWRCGYCHNPHLQDRMAVVGERWSDICRFLKKREGLIDAVVFSGGEPCTDASLASSVGQVRSTGFRVGLHTAGIYPRRLAEVLPLLHWVGLDIKGAPDQYDRITGKRGSATPAFESLHLLLDGDVDHEVRTTLVPGVHTEANVRDLARQLHKLGVKRYVVQAFRATGCTNTAMTAGLHWEPSPALTQELAQLFPQFSLRTGG